VGRIVSRGFSAGNSSDLRADNILRRQAEISYGLLEGTYVELGTERRTADLWKWNVTWIKSDRLGGCHQLGQVY